MAVTGMTKPTIATKGVFVSFVPFVIKGKNMGGMLLWASRLKQRKIDNGAGL